MSKIWACAGGEVTHSDMHMVTVVAGGRNILVVQFLP